MYAPGGVCPIFEEFASTRRLMACELEDAEGRRAILDHPAFGELFVREWHDRDAVSTFNRDLDAMTVERCPVIEWHGGTFGTIRRRLAGFPMGDRSLARRARAGRSARPGGGGRDARWAIAAWRGVPRKRRPSAPLEGPSTATANSCCTCCGVTTARSAGGSWSATTDRGSVKSCCPTRTRCRGSTTAART